MVQGRIVIADDDASLRVSLTRFLQRAGYDVVSAADGHEVLGLLQRAAPDVLLLDIWLSGCDGIEILHTLRARQQPIAAVVMSAQSNVATAVKVMQLGALDYLEKPLVFSQVLAVLTRALRWVKGQEDCSHALATPAARTEAAWNGLTRPVAQVAGQRWTMPEPEPAWSVPRRSVPRSTGRQATAAHLPQRTLGRSAVLYGQGLQSGVKTGMILAPLPPDSGIVFQDIATGNTLLASVNSVESTDFCTNLRQNCVAARTVEHLMSVLHAYRVSNLLVKISNEIPIMDGSASAFCRLIEEVGLAEQDAPAEEFIIDRCYHIGERRSDAKCIRVEPYDGLRITYRLVYPQPLGIQEFTYEHQDSASYREEIAPARTFAFVKEVERMHELELIPGGRLTNVILIDDEKIVNGSHLRFPDECARHKVLDILGDLYLLGRPLRGHVHANMTGHTENIALVKQLHAAMSLCAAQ